MNVIMKFGGTSVADAEAMNRVIDIVRRQWADNRGDLPPVVVVSAMSKVTDALVETGRLAADRQGERAAQKITDLLARHVNVASTLVQGPALDELIARLTTDFEGLAADVRRWAEQGEVTPASSDALHAMGELASSRIVAAAFRQQGVNSAWVDSRQVLVTDAEHSAALPDMESTTERARAIVGPLTAAGQVPVMGGFIGATANGVTTTLGRGGSDYSAAIFGACLDVGRDPDLDRRRRHAHGRPPGGSGPGPRSRTVVHRGLGAGLFRREGAASEHHPPGRREEHPRSHPQLAAAGGAGDDDHGRRARRAAVRSRRSPASAASRSSTSPPPAC